MNLFMKEFRMYIIFYIQYILNIISINYSLTQLIRLTSQYSICTAAPYFNSNRPKSSLQTSIFRPRVTHNIQSSSCHSFKSEKTILLWEKESSRPNPQLCFHLSYSVQYTISNSPLHSSHSSHQTKSPQVMDATERDGLLLSAYQRTSTALDSDSNRE